MASASWVAPYVRAFSTGQRVVVIDVGWELDGQEGCIVEWEATQGSWRVRMEDGTARMLKTQNLRIVAEKRDSMESWREANRNAIKDGSGNLNVEYLQDAEAKRRRGWAERQEAQRTGLHQFLPGQQVRVKGLLDRPEFNHQVGTIVELDFYGGRWKVRFGDGTIRMLKTDNLEIAGLKAPRFFDPTGSAASSFSVGQRVRVKDLQSKSELNGRTVRILEPLNSQGRWKVRFDDGTCVLLKTENLESGEETAKADTAAPAQPDQLDIDTRVRVKGLLMKTELNGQHGCIRELENDQGRWKVRMDDGSDKMLFATNLEIVTGSFHVGRMVRLKGLTARADLNGQVGTIAGWDEPAVRWRVNVKGASKLFKAENLEPW